jgi:hypothetical protein
LDEKYFEFKLTDLPINEFCVLLKPKIQKELVQAAINKFGSWGAGNRLLLHLHKICKSLSKVNFKSLQKGYLSCWKKSKMFIPLDVVIEISRLIGKNPEEIKSHIIKLKHITGKNSNSISFKFVYDKALAALSEIIKVEGHLKKNLRQFHIGNESVDLLNYVKMLLRKIDIKKCDIYEYLKIEADIPNEVEIKEVINTENNKALKFSSKINKGKKRKIMFGDRVKYGTEKRYKILTDKMTINIDVKIPFESKIVGKSNYGIVSPSINLYITNITLCKILHILCGVPTGKKSRKITMCPLIKFSPISVKRMVVSGVMACESWLENSRIRIYLDSLKYLESLNRLLKEFGIQPILRKKYNYISINLRKDLKIFANNFDFIVKEKKIKLGEILSRRKVFKHGEVLLEIIRLIKKNGSITVKDAKKYLNRHKDTAWVHLKKGVKCGLIKELSNFWPYRYSLTKKGEVFARKINSTWY